LAGFLAGSVPVGDARAAPQPSQGLDNTREAMRQVVGGLPRFVRGLVGLDREAAKQAFMNFWRTAGSPRINWNFSISSSTI
jgi:hypothetical protein